mmetsp:Transcript_128820/g.192049  ORF Transcript_128820/g.192049 Transcript_128820/m.192049 type:complete len:106 (+) Transcript_128820:40-357(+)|eukprot:CAMPEP_0117051018 /NCGR_PEP_ID=MMETSP0472-20121206/35230_1 /TAXON_ID=693140 ORGANISM="Tiarina fusus, Strain LIS" /NCGR_SAMPLE_ID=MMETSP0472 /ASSEMBLY_ACC=CAM_ASM_000603 /LENGTH=105 /DNA_ID=CAMNT_0004765031 /DNA_START=39 /DNA_END=356 /DNA_ORIENTATION=-
MKSPSTILCLAAMLTTASCFTSSPHRTPTRSLDSGLCLVPSQAKDLEACAYELMKEALQEKASKGEGGTSVLSRDIANKLTMEPHHNGPVRWARQRLWPFGEKKP